LNYQFLSHRLLHEGLILRFLKREESILRDIAIMRLHKPCITGKRRWMKSIQASLQISGYARVVAASPVFTFLVQKPM
jgi:hypothetical protein